MDRTNSNKRRDRSRSWNNHNRHNDKRQDTKRTDDPRAKKDDRGDTFRPHIRPETPQSIAENENAIHEFKSKVTICEICGQPITDISLAIANRGTGKPVHFDCVLTKLAETEKPGLGDRITYIGQGRFAVLHFDNVHDMRHFKIVKTVEWEEHEKRNDWRDEMADLYSRVK